MPSQNGILSSYSSSSSSQLLDTTKTDDTINNNNNNRQSMSSQHHPIDTNKLLNGTNGHNDDYVINSKEKRRQLRVLICTESFHPYTSGIARRFKEIIGRLARRGFLIHIITGCRGCETWNEDSYYKDKVTFSRLTSIEFKDKIDCNLPFLLPTWGFLHAILTFKPDIVHCVEHTPSSTFCGSLAAFFNIPTVWSSHTNLDYYLPLYIHPISARASVWIYQSLRRLFLNLADYNLTVSSDFAKLLNENGIRKCVHVWKTGVDSELFNPSYRSHEMRVRMFNGHYSPDKTLLVSVGRLSPEKHFDFLLHLLQRFPNAFLCIVGGGPYKDSLEPLFPSHQAHFMGFLQGEELASAYASGDYFVYASISETFGQVYLEAMSSGTPVIAAEGQQMKEFFVNGEHGFTWKPHDVESACQAMQNAMSCDRQVLSRNCRQTALQHSWNNAATQIERVYLDLDTHRQSSKSSSSSGKSSIVARGGEYIKNKAFGVWVLLRWLALMILVVTCMLPFMKVFKPTKQDANNNSENVTDNEMRCETNKKRDQQGSRRRRRTTRSRNNSSSGREEYDEYQQVEREEKEEPQQSNNKKTSFVQSRLDCLHNCFHSLVTRSTSTLIISLACLTALFALCFNTNSFI